MPQKKKSPLDELLSGFKEAADMLEGDTASPSKTAKRFRRTEGGVRLELAAPGYAKHPLGLLTRRHAIIPK